MRTKEEYDAHIAIRNRMESNIRFSILYKILRYFKEDISDECFLNIDECFEYNIRNYLQNNFGVKTNTVKRSEIGYRKKALIHLKWDINTVKLIAVYLNKIEWGNNIDG